MASDSDFWAFLNFRMNTGEQAQLGISEALSRILRQLPTTGPIVLENIRRD